MSTPIDARIEEVTRILADPAWEQDRLAGVLRVVRAMGEEIERAQRVETISAMVGEKPITLAIHGGLAPIVKEHDIYRERLALADAAMPIIRSQGFVQFGPNCMIHADKIAPKFSPIIREAFLTWMESVGRYHAAKGEECAAPASASPAGQAGRAGPPPRAAHSAYIPPRPRMRAALA